MTLILLTIVACVAIASNVVLTIANNRTAPKPPDLYLSINVVPEIEEDEGDDPDEDDLETEVLEPEHEGDDPTMRTN